MTARFPGLVVQDWRTRLLDRHPRLFPDARIVQTEAGPMLAASGWPCVPEGWRSVVDTLCRRLGRAIAAEPEPEPEAEVKIFDLDEKWGTLRVAIGNQNLGEAAQAAVTLAVDLAEARSAHVCDTCGGPGRLSQWNGWYATRCEAHAEGHRPVRDRHPDFQIVTTFVEGRRLRAARRYDPVGDTFVPADLPEDGASPHAPASGQGRRSILRRALLPRSANPATLIMRKAGVQSGRRRPCRRGAAPE